MKNILIVEDEADMCFTSGNITCSRGVRLDHVKSISLAADYLKSHSPSMVILDNKLPRWIWYRFYPGNKKRLSGS